MANIVILGAGVMGSALAVTAATHPNNSVTLVGSPLDGEIISSLQTNGWHPTLQVSLDNTIHCVHEAGLSGALLDTADAVVIGVSSPGMQWAVQAVTSGNQLPDCIALVTKGLVASDNQNRSPLTYADSLKTVLDTNRLIGIGGPCIARELALGLPTFVTYAAFDVSRAAKLRQWFQTEYYRIAIHPDLVGVEACAALKNFYCIGVAAMLGAWQIEGTTAKNPVAALFNQAVIEMNIISNWIRNGSESHNAAVSDWNNVAFDLAGLGDLHVTVGGGRNSRLGTLLGQGHKLSEITQGPMKGVTVEGLDTGRQLQPGLQAALAAGDLSVSELPLTVAILHSIASDALFEFDFSSYCAPTPDSTLI